MKIVYKYIGKGSFVAGIPARDLDADDVKKYGEVTIRGTHLYQKVAETKKVRPKREDKSRVSPVENKEQ